MKYVLNIPDKLVSILLEQWNRDRNMLDSNDGADTMEKILGECLLDGMGVLDLDTDPFTLVADLLFEELVSEK
jgi:hypothetical protein